MKKEIGRLIEYVKYKNYKKVAIIYTLNDFWASYRDALIELTKKEGIDIVAIESSEFLNVDLRTQLIKIKNTEPDVIFAGLNAAPLANMLKQMEELGINLPIIGIWQTQTPDLISAAGELANGIVYTYHYRDGVTPNNIEYSKKYKELYKEEVEFASTSTYDIIYIIKFLIEKCGENKIACMINETNKIENYEGASGIVTFSNGTTLKEIYLRTIENSTFVEYTG